MAKVSNAQIEKMEKLGFSPEEIADIIKCDEEIDHGAKLFELDPEKEKIAKEARICGTRKAPTNYKLDNTNGKRSKKENATKAGIVSILFDFLTKNTDLAIENAEIVNKERQIAFSIGSNQYELTLVQKRKPKN